MTVDTAVTTMFEGFKTNMKNELAMKVSTKNIDKIMSCKTDATTFQELVRKVDELEGKVNEFATDADDCSDPEDEMDIPYENSQEDYLIDELDNVSFKD
jgi:hypothetical protein